jgi:hypothetical protein
MSFLKVSRLVEDLQYRLKHDVLFPHEECYDHQLFSAKPYFESVGDTGPG